MLSSVNVPTEGLFLRSRFDAIGRMNVLLTNVLLLLLQFIAIKVDTLS